MKIANSKGIGTGPSAWKYLQYTAWINAIDPFVGTVELSSLQRKDALRALESCDGLVLSGGPDIDPSRYGQPAEAFDCIVDAARDRREWEYVETALARRIPILGICRGMQLLNVYFGGTLIGDIPRDVPNALVHRTEGKDVWHSIMWEEDSLLGCGGKRSAVNSAHHQAVATLAPVLKDIARSPDGIIEACTWANPRAESFVLGVQWHPERMHVSEQSSRLIGDAFLSAAYGFIRSS